MVRKSPDEWYKARLAGSDSSPEKRAESIETVGKLSLSLGMGAKIALGFFAAAAVVASSALAVSTAVDVYKSRSELLADEPEEENPYAELSWGRSTSSGVRCMGTDDPRNYSASASICFAADMFRIGDGDNAGKVGAIPVLLTDTQDMSLISDNSVLDAQEYLAQQGSVGGCERALDGMREFLYEDSNETFFTQRIEEIDAFPPPSDFSMLKPQSADLTQTGILTC